MGKGGRGGDSSSIVSFSEADNVAINSWVPSIRHLCYLCDPYSLPHGNIKSEEAGLGALYSEARSQRVKKHGSVRKRSASLVPWAAGLGSQDEDFQAFPGDI